MESNPVRGLNDSTPTVFVSYSHHDAHEKEALLSHLGILQNAGLIDLWSEDCIRGGSDWVEEIKQAIARARVAVLLISANYLNTAFILDQQIPILLKRRKSEGLTVFPIIAKACAWQTIDWLAQMRVRPASGQPIWRAGGLHVDEELATIATEIAEIIAKKKGDPSAVTKPDSDPSQPSVPQRSRYYSCFICYASSDQRFAEQVHQDLQQQGVNCWFALKDMKIGAKIRPTIYRSIQAHDKLLLVLSENSIHSQWVESEVEAAFEEERKRGEIILFPIRLDDTVMRTDQAWAADIRRTRHIGDFTRWTEHDAYQQALEQLLRDLEA